MFLRKVRGSLEKKEIEEGKELMGKLTKEEVKISVMEMLSMSTEIWSLQAQSQFITEVFKEEPKRFDLAQISLIMDEYLAFQYYARLGLLKV